MSRIRRATDVSTKGREAAIAWRTEKTCHDRPPMMRRARCPSWSVRARSLFCAVRARRLARSSGVSARPPRQSRNCTLIVPAIGAAGAGGKDSGQPRYFGRRINIRRRTLQLAHSTAVSPSPRDRIPRAPSGSRYPIGSVRRRGSKHSSIQSDQSGSRWARRTLEIRASTRVPRNACNSGHDQRWPP